MKASTAPKGRIAEEHGYPMHMCKKKSSIS